MPSEASQTIKDESFATENVEIVLQETPLAYRAVRGGVWVALSSYWTIGWGFIVNIGLTRILSAEAFGQFEYALFFAQLFALSPKLGLKYAFIQHKDTTGEALGTYIAMEFMAVVGSLLITLVAAPFLPGSVFPICLVLAVTAFANLSGVGVLLLEKELFLGRTSLIESIIVPLSYAPAVVLALRGYGVWSLVAQVVAQRLLTLVVYSWIMRHQLSRLLRLWRNFDPKLAWHFLQLSLTVGASAFVGSLTISLDSFLIGRFVGEAPLGYYDRARRMARWPSTLLTNMVSRTSLYTYARIQDEPAKLRKAITLVSWAITLLAFPIALMTLIAAPEIINLLYGERWLSSVPFLIILVLISAAWPLVENLSTLFTAIGKPKINLWSSAIQVLVIAAVGLPMTIAWGAMGTCVAMALAFLVRLVFIFYAAAREISIKPLPVLATPTISAVIVLFGYAIINYFIDFDTMSLLIRFGIKGLLSFFLYFCIVVLLEPSRTRERLTYVWGLFKG